MMDAERIQELREQIERCLYESRGLNQWETEFLASISEQLDDQGSLTKRQIEILEKIEAEKLF